MSDEPRQRWRVTFRRDAAAATLGGRDVQAAIDSSLARAGIPVAGRTQLATALPTGMASDGELLDVTLTERWDVARAWTALASVLPPGHEVVACHDVWLGEAALAAQTRGAEYRIELGLDPARRADLRVAAAALLASERVIRTRTKGDRAVEYDLRPFLEDVEIEPNGPTLTLRVRVRIDPERGTGRPEEVVAALGDQLGEALEVVATTRTRIVLAS